MLVYQRVLTNYQLLQPTMNFQSLIDWFRIGAEKSTIMQIGYIHLNHHSLMDFYHMTYIYSLYSQDPHPLIVKSLLIMVKQCLTLH
jgi:hypothetical protein